MRRENFTWAYLQVSIVMKPFELISPTFLHTPVKILARAMIMNTISGPSKGSERVENKEIHALGNSLPE